MRLEVLQHLLHCGNRCLQCRIGVENHGISHALELIECDHGRYAACNDVDELRRLHALGNLNNLLPGSWRLNKCHVGASFDIGGRALYRVLKAMGREGISARNDDEIRVDPGVGGGTNFLNHVGRGDDALSGEMSASLWKFLILELDGIGPAAFENTDGACDVERVAETGVCVDDQR